MSGLWLVIVVGIVFYLLNKDYNSKKFHHINLDKKEPFDGDLNNHEAGLLIAMMAKVAKADGNVCELEAELLSHTFTDISNHFENSIQIRGKLKEIYKIEKESFDNTIIVAKKYLALTKNDYTKRLKVMEYLLNIAFIDNDFCEAEFMITQDIATALEIKEKDFNNLIEAFRAFYAQRENSEALNTQKACQILGVNENDDFTTIKKAYRKLVKQYHPDIIAGSGADQSIIEEATKKLQEINEAYELLKKGKK